MMQKQSIKTIQKLGAENQALISRCIDLALFADIKHLQEIDAQLRQLLALSKKAESVDGATHYIWRTQGDGKVRASHAANEGQIFSWSDAPETGHPGSDYGCRCWAEPYYGLVEERYKPEEDELFMAGYYTWGQIAALDLYGHNKLIQEQANLKSIDPTLIKGVITNEIITRLGASGGDAIISGFLSLVDDRGNGGTYGPAQLGREARLAAGLTISDSLTYEGAIKGAANWLDKERQELVKMGMKNPTNAQIASKYNLGSANGRITKYGTRVQFLIDRLYKKQ